MENKPPIKKPYCTQNDGDCTTCSLTNHGRDCQNHLGDDWAITVSGACPSFNGLELIAVAPHMTHTHNQARAYANYLELLTGRIMYLSKIRDLVNVKG